MLVLKCFNCWKESETKIGAFGKTYLSGNWHVVDESKRGMDRTRRYITIADVFRGSPTFCNSKCRERYMELDT